MIAGIVVQGCPLSQTPDDRKYILANLPQGTSRIQLVLPDGKQAYKRPDDVDVEVDEIALTQNGSPIIMRGAPGRRPRSNLQPVTQVIAEIDKAREEHVIVNPLLKYVKNASEDDAYNQIMIELAAEAASIDFERLEAQRHGVESSNLSMRKARILKTLHECMITQKKASVGGLINLESQEFRALFAYILDTFKESMEASGARSELVESTFTHIGKELDAAWSQEARRRMKAATQ